jgi:branched-chain amino acid transport system substrate-binding protein
MRRLIVALMFTAMCAWIPSANAEEIHIGGLFDLSGATGTGLAVAEGVRDYVKYTNDNGGILGGKTIVLNEFDTEWKVPVALKAYENLVRNKNIKVMFGYGTGPSIAISPKTTKDKVLYMGAGCHVEPLVNGNKTPYVFVVGVTYSDELMLMAQHFLKTWDKQRKPRVQNFLPGKLNFVADRAKKYLEGTLNMTVLPHIAAEAQAVDASSQMLKAKKNNADLFMTVSGSKGIAAVLMARYKLHLTKIPSYGISYGLDKNVIRIAGRGSNNGLTNDYTTAWGSDAPEMMKMVEFNKKNRPQVKIQSATYKRGWLTAMVLFEAIRRAGNMDPTKIKESLENMKDFSTNGLTANITYSKENHKGLDATYIYRTDFSNKTFQQIGFESFKK